MSGGIACVDEWFQKVLIGVYGNQMFLELTCGMGEFNSCNFGTNGLCLTLLKTQRAGLSEMFLFCVRI